MVPPCRYPPSECKITLALEGITILPFGNKSDGEKLNTIKYQETSNTDA